MAETYKMLSQGRLASGIADIYTVPSSTSAIVKNIILVNNHSVAVTAELCHDGDAEENRILPPISIDAGGWAEFNGAICMSATEALSGVASIADEITYTIYGLEIS